MRRRRRHLSRDRGAVLIISLWVLTLLSLLAIGLAYRMSLELHLADYDLTRFKLFHLVQGGLREAYGVLLQDGTETDSFQDGWARPTDPKKPVSLGDGSFLLAIEDELSRVDLNSADQETLMRVPGMEESVALSLRSWRGDPGMSPSLLEKEEAYYQSLGRWVERERGPIQSFEELALVRGMTPSLQKSLEALFTVYGPGKVNLNTVSEEALVLLGLEDSLVHELILYRSGEDGELGTEDDHVFRAVSELTASEFSEEAGLTTDQSLDLVNFLTKYQKALTVQSDHFRVRCQATAGNRMTKEVVAVFQRLPAALPVIKYWHED